jgi:hypothetical protein
VAIAHRGFLAAFFSLLALGGLGLPLQIGGQGQVTVEANSAYDFPQMTVPWRYPPSISVCTTEAYGFFSGTSTPHNGIDFAGNSSQVCNGVSPNFHVLASAAGTARHSDTELDSCANSSGGPGANVNINHGVSGNAADSPQVWSHYMHLKRGTIAVSKLTPRYVERAEYLAEAGDTGYSCGNHLHFAVAERSQFGWVNPDKFFSDYFYLRAGGFPYTFQAYTAYAWVRLHGYTFLAGRWWPDGDEAGYQNSVAYSQGTAGYTTAFPHELGPRNCELPDNFYTWWNKGCNNQLMLAGRRTGAGHAYTYMRLWDSAPIPNIGPINMQIKDKMFLRWRQWDYQDYKMAPDLCFTSGQCLRDFHFFDQQGIFVHPAHRTGAYGQFQYYYVQMDQVSTFGPYVGQSMAGKVVNTTLIGFDSSSGSAGAQYRSYFDELILDWAGGG